MCSSIIDMSASAGGGKAASMRIVFALVAATALLLVGCQRRGQEDDSGGAEGGRFGARGAELEAPVETIFAVDTVLAVQGELNEYIQLNGDVEASVNVDILPETGGELTRLYVGLGDFVRRNQRIAAIDPSGPGRNFAAHEVTSPISGTITDVPFQVGSTIGQGTPVARVARTDVLEIRASVAERFISKVGLGRAALLRFEAWPGIQFPASVVELSPVVNPVSRTLDIKLVLDSPDGRIRPGMYADIRLITDIRSPIVKIPADCVVERFGQSYVYVVQPDNSVRERQVEPGIRIDNKLEIISGLQPNEEVVFRGQTLLDDGVKIRVVNQVEPLSVEDQVP